MQHPPDTEVDVIILSWNRLDDTIAAITSAADQQDVSHRIFIVDQGSTPDNVARLEEFVAGLPCAQLKILGRNTGVAGGRNIATAMGHAPYIVALDSDAIFADQHMLARVVSHMNRNPQLCAIGFRINNYFTEQNDDTSWDYLGSHSPDQHFPSTRFVGAGHAIRRSSFEAVGGYDARLFFCGEEVDLCYRMLNLGMRIEYVPEVTIRHKVSTEHRVFWEKGRFFYTVRNALYTMYKFEMPAVRRAVAAAAFLIRGSRNGIPWEAVRGIMASRRLSKEYRLSQEDKSQCRLSASTWEYIFACEPRRRDSLAAKVRRQLIELPHQGA